MLNIKSVDPITLRSWIANNEALVIDVLEQVELKGKELFKKLS